MRSPCINSRHRTGHNSPFQPKGPLASALRADLAAKGHNIKHSAALGLLAKNYGQRDCSTLHAAISNEPCTPVYLGQIVPGHHLKQEFLAEVIGSVDIAECQFEEPFDLDKSVDVVTFDSFSNFRKPVRKMIGPDGSSADKTSDGVRDLILWE